MFPSAVNSAQARTCGMAGIMPLLDPFARGDPEARPEGAAGRMVVGRPPQSRFEMTLAVAFGPSRELKWTGTAGTHLVLMDAPRIHHEAKTQSRWALSRQNRRSMGMSVEPEGARTPDLPITSRRHYVL